MNECMPHYYKITNGHGRCGNADVQKQNICQGHMVDAQIELEQVYSHIEGNNQENIRLCCDFLALRLALLAGFSVRQTIEQRTGRDS